MPQAVEQLLRTVKTSDRVRAVAFDAVYNMDDAAAEQALRDLQLPQEVKAQLWDARQPKEATPPPSAATAGMMPPSTIEGDPGYFESRGIAGGRYHAPTGAGNVATRPDTAIVGTPVMDINPEDVIGGLGLGKVAAAAIPTRAKAGAKFQQVMQKVGDKPIDVARPGDAALRISELAERGGAMPKAVRDFLKRATDPAKADMSYKEARDFYSNISRLSADEMKRLTPVVRKELNQLRVALNDALAKTAQGGGQEQVYREAMREYALASRMREFAETAAKYGAGAVGAGAAYKMVTD